MPGVEPQTTHHRNDHQNFNLQGCHGPASKGSYVPE